MPPPKTPDEYYAKERPFRAELQKLRAALLPTGLAESIKWGAPSYDHEGTTVVGVAAFKNHFALWFHQGALLSDSKQVLSTAGDGTAKAMRQWRMTSGSDIKPAIIRAYVNEAIALKAAGQRIAPDRAKPLTLPPELRAALKTDPKAGDAFKALSKSLRREYADHIASAKQAATKDRRIEKILPMIRSGVGLNDKYRR